MPEWRAERKDGELEPPAACCDRRGIEDGSEPDEHCLAMEAWAAILGYFS